MKKNTLTPYRVICAVILAVLAVFFLFPLYWIITGSVKEKSDIIIKSGEMVKWIPTTITWDNYQRLFKTGTKLFGIGMPMAIRWLFNSVFISVVAMGLTCATSSLAGYALAKKRFWGKGLIFGLFVCAMALPKQVILIPLMTEMSNLGLLKSVWGSMFAVIFPVVGWPFGVFLMKQFSENIPSSLLEAARIDGANEFYIFHKIVLPMSKNGIFSIAIFQFLWAWEDFLWPYLVITNKDKQLLAVGLKMFNGQYSTDYGALFAATAISIIPVLLIYLFFQKQFIAGIAASAVKG